MNATHKMSDNSPIMMSNAVWLGTFNSQNHRHWCTRNHAKFCNDQRNKFWRSNIVHKVENVISRLHCYAEHDVCLSMLLACDSFQSPGIPASLMGHLNKQKARLVHITLTILNIYWYHLNETAVTDSHILIPFKWNGSLRMQCLLLAVFTLHLPRE